MPTAANKGGGWPAYLFPVQCDWLRGRSPDERYQLAHDIAVELKWLAEPGKERAAAALLVVVLVAGFAVWLLPRVLLQASAYHVVQRRNRPGRI